MPSVLDLVRMSTGTSGSKRAKQGLSDCLPLLKNRVPSVWLFLIVLAFTRFHVKLLLAPSGQKIWDCHHLSCVTITQLCPQSGRSPLIKILSVVPIREHHLFLAETQTEHQDSTITVTPTK